MTQTGSQSCPKCSYGTLHTIGDDERSKLERCFHCGYTASSVKPGYFVAAPGSPIEKNPPRKSKASTTPDTNEEGGTDG